MDNNNNMPFEVFLRIGQNIYQQNIYGQNICTNDYNPNANLQKINIEKYKDEYLQKLLKQLNGLQYHRDELIEEYASANNFNLYSIEKITELNTKLNRQRFYGYSNSSANFLSLQTKKIKTYLNDTIQANIQNSQKLYELEQQILAVELYIRETKKYINLL